MSVIATPGATANSYCSNAVFIAICAADPHKQDYPTTEAEQDRILQTATLNIDDDYGPSYDGTIYDTSYALYWPRTGVIDERTGLAIETYTTFPEALQRATAYQAYHIYKNDRKSEVADNITGVKRKKLDTMEIEYAAAGDQALAYSRPTIHPEVARILATLSSGSVSSYVSTMFRG